MSFCVSVPFLSINCINIFPYYFLITGNAAKAQLLLKYVDDDFRIVQDVDGEYFVYTRPVVSRI